MTRGRKFKYTNAELREILSKIEAQYQSNPKRGICKAARDAGFTPDTYRMCRDRLNKIDAGEVAHEG